ncbi:MAG: hypothetical protein B6U86_04505 [Candidatus Altiarchaeales archaeon ex4484_43]|nr:MAG: hypothetical protein B6U86_04505 [Candidatus Altiarchaeales archaeon ex4484_43]
MKPILQVALNSMDLEASIEIAKRAVSEGIEWIEVGHPLIKSEGLNAVREIKRIFPDKKILADMKLVHSAIEIEAAAKVGADIILILGTTPDKIIEECVDKAHENNVGLMADITNISPPLEISKKLQKLGINYLCVDMENLKEISDSVQIPVAVFTGSDPEAASRAVEQGAAILILDEITEKRRVGEVTTEIKRLMEFKSVPPSIRISKELDNIKNVILNIEEQRRIEEERYQKALLRERKRIDDEISRLEEERRGIEEQKKNLEEKERDIEEHRRRIREEWGKIKEAEIAWEDKQKRKLEEYKAKREAIWKK